MSKKRQSKSDRWRREQLKNQYTQKARVLGYRSRSALKLIEIDDAHRLLTKAKFVVDLGAAPGGWSQVISKRIAAGGRAIAVDILPMKDISGVFFLQGDFLEPTTTKKITDYLGGQADLVLSDMAPNISGIAVSDQAQSVNLGFKVAAFCRESLSPGGNLVIKVFQGEDEKRLHEDLAGIFKEIKAIRTKATRPASKELYLFANGRD